MTHSRSCKIVPSFFRLIRGNAFLDKWILLLLLFQTSTISVRSATLSSSKAYDYLIEQQWEQAIIAYETMLTTEQNNPELHFNLGIAYFKTFRFSSAQQSFERALLLNIEAPDFQAKAEYNIGVTMFEQAKLYASVDKTRSTGYLKEAVFAFENTLELQPENEPAQRNLEICRSILVSLQKNDEPSEEESNEGETSSESSDQPPPASDAPSEENEKADSDKKSDPGQKTPEGAGNPDTARKSENPETTDKVAGTPGAQRLDLQEALLLLDSIENGDKRITLSDLLEPSEKSNTDSEANW